MKHNRVDSCSQANWVIYCTSMVRLSCTQWCIQGRGRCPWLPKFIHPHASFEKCLAKNSGMKGLAPTPMENPRSATGTVFVPNIPLLTIVSTNLSPPNFAVFKIYIWVSHYFYSFFLVMPTYLYLLQDLWYFPFFPMQIKITFKATWIQIKFSKRLKWVTFDLWKCQYVRSFTLRSLHLVTSFLLQYNLMTWAIWCPAYND